MRMRLIFDKQASYDLCAKISDAFAPVDISLIASKFNELFPSVSKGEWDKAIEMYQIMIATALVVPDPSRLTKAMENMTKDI